MTKFLVACSAILFVFSNVRANSADTSATITSSKNNYQFVYNQKENRVEVKQELKTDYISNKYQVTIPVSEGYNDQSSIDDVLFKLDNRSSRDFKPVYSYYSINDIFYSDARICYFPVRLAKKGSTAQVTFKKTLTDPRYFTTIYFSEDLATDAKEISLKIPRWMKVELKELNFGNHNIKKNTVYDSSSDADIITYTAQNLPAMESEDNAPGPTYIYPHLLVLCKAASPNGKNFTYFNTLSDQYGWYRELVKATINDQEVIGAKAKELTAGINTDFDKVKAIFYYVQHNIRYLAFEDGIAGFKPDRAEEVLRKKYGDCKGMANLTKALLTSLGFDARLCWLGTNHIAYDYQTPSISVDNHMICGLNFGGKTIFLDATESYLGINEYAERIQGRQVLMEDGDQHILTRIPMAAAGQNYDFESRKLSISGNNLVGSVNHLWKGEDKERFLSGLNSIKKEKADDAVIRFLSAGDGNYNIQGVKVSSTYDSDKDLTVQYTVDHKNAVSTFSKSYYVDLDFKKEFLNGTIKAEERKHDYWFDYKMNIQKEAELTIPEGYKPSVIPAKLDIVNPDYEFHISYTLTPGKLNYKKTILIKNTKLTTSKFEQWNKDVEQLAKTYNESVILKSL